MNCRSVSVFAPVYYFFGGGVAWSFSNAIFAALCFMALLLGMRHRLNIDRLIKGSESRIGGAKK